MSYPGARHAKHVAEHNLQIVGRNWTVTLLPAQDVPGAYALPGGKIATRDMIDTMARRYGFTVRELTLS